MIKKSRIRETKHLSTDADSSTDAIGRLDQGKISKKKTFFCAAILDHFQTKMFKCQTTSFHYFSPRIPNLLRYWTSDFGSKRPLKKTENRTRPKKVKKKNFFFARRFQAIFNQKCSYLIPLLSITFPQGFRISKNIGPPTSGSGGKKTVKKDQKPKKTEKSEEKNFFFLGDFRQFSNKNVHI